MRLYSYLLIHFNLLFRLFIWGLNTNTAHASGVENKSKRSLDQSRIGAILCGDDTSIKSGPPVKAILIQNANPALVAPNSKKVRRGLSREDLFVCVHEHFKTETARYADLLLPATMFVEHDDLYMGWGHTGLTIGKQILEPSEECLSNAQLINILGRRLGADHESFHLHTYQKLVHFFHQTSLAYKVYEPH